MSPETAPVATIPAPGMARGGVDLLEQPLDRPTFLWTVLALLNFVALIMLRHDLAPGEFGTLNTALGAIGLALVPVLALDRSFTLYLALQHPAARRERIEALRAAALPVLDTWARVWGAISLGLGLLLIPLIDLPRFPLELFVLLNIAAALGAVVSGRLCGNANRRRIWWGLLMGAAAARVLVSIGLAGSEPWAESGLTASLVAGIIMLVPALRSPGFDPSARLAALRSMLDREFLLYLAATFTVTLALFLFSSADRIVAQSWFGVASGDNLGFVRWDIFDAYQAAGLLGRALLWGTQPLLWILFAQRSRLDRTTAGSLTYFWLYLGALIGGAMLLNLLGAPLSQVISGDDYLSTAFFVPIFSLAIVPLGLLQALGIFALASRRWHECFALGACSIGYTLLLYLAGRRPELMPAYMFGGGLVSVMVVLFIGVVRWGRRQP